VIQFGIEPSGNEVKGLNAWHRENTMPAPPHQPPDEFRELRDGLHKACQITSVDPEMALARCRKALEWVVRDVYLRRFHEPPGTRPLENLVERLVKQGVLPGRLDAYATLVRKLGNVGTHRSGEGITPADVRHSLAQLRPVLEWYFTVERRVVPPFSLADLAPPCPGPAPEALADLIKGQQRLHVRESYGEAGHECFTDEDLRRFRQGEEAERIAGAMRGDSRFRAVLAAIRELPPVDRHLLLEGCRKPLRRTWAELGAITREGQTEAGQEAELLIATAIVALVKAELAHS
jgi:Domain of unknown function (DUF4145)